MSFRVRQILACGTLLPLLLCYQSCAPYKAVSSSDLAARSSSTSTPLPSASSSPSAYVGDAMIKFTLQPVGSVIGRTLSAQPVVEIQDSHGNLLKNASVPVNVSLVGSNSNQPNPAGANVSQLTGTTTLITEGGVATFTNLAVTQPGSNMQLVASSPGYTSDTSTSFQVTTTAEPGMTVYYVSPNGSDTNPGTSEAAPWASVNKVNSFVFKPGDVILFQGGQSFTGCMNLISSHVPGSTASNGLSVSSYGGGSFTIQANCFGLVQQGESKGLKTAAITVSGISGFRLSNAILRGAVGQTDGTPVGVYVETGTGQNISITNCDIGGFYSKNPSVVGAEIYIPAGLGNGVYVGSNTLHGLGDASSPDDNGIEGDQGGAPSMKNVIYEKNLVYNIGGRPNTEAGFDGNGINTNGVINGLVQYNVVHDVGGNTNTCGGPCAFMAHDSDNVTIQYNEAYNVQPVSSASYTNGCDWDGFDLDQSVTNSTLQYNYSHNNAGAGLLGFDWGTWGNNTIRYNFSENDAFGVRPIGALSVWAADAPDHGTKTQLYAYNNTIYVSAASSQKASYAGWGFMIEGTNVSGLIANNIFNVMAVGGYDNKYSNLLNSAGQNPTALTFTNIDYYGLISYQTSTKQDQLSGGYNPQLANPGFAGTCSVPLAQCLANYQLNPASPAIGAGLDLTKAPYNLNVGAKDLFGNSIPSSSGTGYNVGAFAGQK